MRYKVLDTVVLDRDLPQYGLRSGDLGAVLQVYEPDGLEVEFVTASGKTQALATLNVKDVRPVQHTDDHPLLRTETPAAQDLAGIAGVVNDLSFAADAVDRLLAIPEKTRDDNTLTRALWSSALIAYMRCFSEGVRYSLNPTIFPVIPEADVAHKFFKDLRDKHIAHPVNAFEDCGVGLLVPPGTTEVLGVGELLLFQLTPSEQNLKVFQSLTQHALQWAQAERQRLRSVVIAEARELSKQDLRNLKPLRLTPPVSATKVRKGARSN